MIKVEELRLGNYVMYNGMVMSVSEILSPKPRKDERYNNKYVIELFDGAGLLSATLDQIEVIPLSKEWLEKIGFIPSHWDKREISLSDGKFYCSFKFYKNGRTDCFFCGEKESTVYEELSIRYVHRIQNLYSSLNFKNLKLCSN